MTRRRGQSSGLQSCRWTGRHSVVVGSPTVVVVTSGSFVEVVVGEAAGSLDGATVAGAATLAAWTVAAGPPAPPLGMPPGCWPFPFHPDHPPLRPPPLLPVLLGEWPCTGRGSGTVPAACADGPRPPGPTWGTTPTSNTPASPTAAASRTPPRPRDSRRSRSDRIGITVVAGGGSSSPPSRRRRHWQPPWCRSAESDAHGRIPPTSTKRELGDPAQLGRYARQLCLPPVDDGVTLRRNRHSHPFKAPCPPTWGLSHGPSGAVTPWHSHDDCRPHDAAVHRHREVDGVAVHASAHAWTAGLSRRPRPPSNGATSGTRRSGPSRPTGYHATSLPTRRCWRRSTAPPAMSPTSARWSATWTGAG